MRAEDLFEAIGEIDEELIARSGKRARKGGAKKRKKSASVYRFVVVAASTAAAVLLFLMVRDFIGGSSLSRAPGSQASITGSDALLESVEENQAMAAEEELHTIESVPPSDETGSAAGDQNAQAQADQSSGEEVSRSVPQKAEDSVSGADEKTAVDLLGSNKGDYVKLEYISAEDKANGAGTTIPEYTQEGEKALSVALDSGKGKPAILADTGQPVYYVYLTKENGDVDTITFYENSCVSMNTIPGMVMIISQAEYEAVLKLFR